VSARRCFQTLEDAIANLGACKAAARGRLVGLLIDMRRARPLSSEVRHYYSGEQLVGVFSALGLLIEASPLGRMMGNVYLRVVKVGIPARLFADEAEAIAWLQRAR
jgi:hypothetical protein